ncbi:MAG: metallophosphoesterase family protein [Rubrivivax sp.]
MRLAVVSDIHGNLPALLAVAAEIDAARAGRVLNLGDIASGPLWPRETLDWLAPRGWTTIRGNHERQLQGARQHLSAADVFAFDALTDAHKAWLAALPTEARLDGGDVQLVHGTPGSDLDYLLETVTADFGVGGSPGVRAARDDEVRARLGGGCAASLLLCGHTHVPRVALAGGTLVVNPGSVGLQAYDDGRPHPHIVETGSPHARWALVERVVGGGWRVEQRLTAYDWHAAAARAQANGRGDWADALRSGRLGRTEAQALSGR